MKKIRKIISLFAAILMSVQLYQPVLAVSISDLQPPENSWLETARAALAELTQEREIMALVYLSDEYPVRTAPDYDSETAVTVLSGQQVDILDVSVSDDGEIWEYVRLEYGGQEFCGYVPRTNLACSDQRFLEWEEQYGLNPVRIAPFSTIGAPSYPDIDKFPASYRPALLELKKKHPNWTFAVLNTNLDWNTAVAEEMKGGRSLVHSSLPGWAKDGLYDNGSWYYATEEALKLYMDPRSHLTEDEIFQFELLIYNEQYHTKAAVEKILNSTFMNGSQNAPGTSKTYAQIFWEVGSAAGRKVSPFHLVARVIQEQGKGTSPLISGTCADYGGQYAGYYNYFNVGASGKTTQQVIENGLKYAKEHNWKDAYTSIAGGADVISANYIRQGQYTLYLQKFNVNPEGHYKPYEHQYMQNISAPCTEASKIKQLYTAANAFDSTFVFSIPVFQNMPSAACGVPAVSTEVALKLPDGYSDTTVWLDGIPVQGTIKDGKLVAKAADSKAKTAVVYRYDEAGVPTNMYVWSLKYNGTLYKATAEPELENLLTYHGFSIRITGKSGIRFKTGVSAQLREKLTSTGVNGYTLKEYGTLIMKESNRGKYPMIKGGEKVLSGMAYGTDENGKRQDVVYEIADGRYRYTSVLVGMPPEQYKEEYAFRGYAVLEKGGSQIVVYGPPKARSIYSLAQQLLKMGSYESSSDAYKFLEKLIRDADAVQSK